MDYNYTYSAFKLKSRTVKTLEILKWIAPVYYRVLSVKPVDNLLLWQFHSERRIMHLDLNFHPFTTDYNGAETITKIRLYQRDIRSRHTLYSRLVQPVTEANLIQLLIMIINEARIQLSGKVNKQICRYWSSENHKHEF